MHGDGQRALSTLRAQRIADEQAFVVVGTLTIPMRNGDAPHASPPSAN